MQASCRAEGAGLQHTHDGRMLYLLLRADEVMLSSAIHEMY